LVEALADVMVVPLDDAMTPEVIAVPTHGVERWLSQRLSDHLGASGGRADGVCANVDFPFPGRLVGTAVAAASGIDRHEDPWLPERAVWPLLDVVDQCVGEPWLASLAAHLGAGGSKEEPDLVRRGRRFSSIRHIADLYDSYGVRRPEMLRAWAAGVDTDGDTRPLPSDAAWQAELWRRLRTRVAVPSPAERLGEACDRLSADAAVVPLPARLALFGLTRLPASYLQVLVALAVARDVHLFLLHPSPVLWARVAAASEGRRPARRRADDPTADLPRNPLLASWASDSREVQLVLGGVPGTAGGVVQDHRHPPRGTPAPSPTVLRRIQADVAEDRCPPGTPLPAQHDERPLLDPDDRSLQVHACHGLARQVEVIRDAILHALREDATLEARDVIVMCPDIETFAPLVHATFGAGDPLTSEEPAAGPPAVDDEAHPADHPPDLRVRLADRSLRQTNPVLGVVAELLHLASARLTASQVLDLAGREPIRRRFGFDDDALAQVQEWATATGIRWALDAAGRAPFKLSALADNTWESGFDRVLLGVAMAEEQQRLVGGVLPLDDVGSGDIDLAGRFAEFLDRLHGALEGLRLLQTVEQWRQAIARAADALTVASGLDGWQREQLETLLDDMVLEATADHTTASPSLTLPEVRSLLTDRLRGQPTRANFRTGHLTVCTMVPMRSVPHRVVCLLGLDDGVFPRKAARDGDDLLLADPHVGDRDSRSEDRQLLLDALMAATDRLIITYAARDERTNAERPPAVPVGELLDVLDRTVRTAPSGDGEAPPGRATVEAADGAALGIRDPSGTAREAVVIHHPLQPFDPRNFTTGRLLPGEAWSFDVVALDGARALSGPRHDARVFLDRPLPAVRTDPVELDQLVRFVQHPVRAFLRQRLGVSLGEYAKEVGDALPVQLDKLEQWGVGQRLLDARLTGADFERCKAAEMARGILPPNAFAEPVLDEIRPIVEDLVAAAHAAELVELDGGVGEWGSVDIHLPLPDGRILVGTVPEVSGNLLRAVTYSRVGAKHRLAAWVRFLALTAAYPDRGYHAATLGRVRADSRNARITTAFLPAFEGDADTCRKLALNYLQEFIDLYDRGLRQPLPLYCQTSASYANARAAGNNPQSVAKLTRAAWETRYGFDREDKDPEHLLVLGGPLGLDAILQMPPEGDETGDGWAADESTRFGRYARRLWDGLLACEQLVDA
jgi:exodeoxyribonuclease V gamma subunit